VDIPQLLQERSCGSVRVAFTKNHHSGLQEIVDRLGLQASPDDFRQVETVEATAILAIALARDLAYNVQLMSSEVARRRAAEFLSENIEPGACVYVNATRDGDQLATWSPVTRSTFDACVLVVNDSFAACVLVEDED